MNAVKITAVMRMLYVQIQLVHTAVNVKMVSMEMDIFVNVCINIFRRTQMNDGNLFLLTGEGSNFTCF